MKNLLSGSAAVWTPPLGIDPSEPTILHQFYHTETFQLLIERGAEEIKERLFVAPRALRLAGLAPNFKVRGQVSGEEAWQPLRDYLELVESRMAELIQDHSPAYWIHLYRRIAPTLSKGHDSKIDATTVALVRQTAELAYLKYGDLSRRGEIGDVRQSRLDNLLGGYYYEAISKRLGSKLKARKQYDQLRRSSQYVLLDFAEETFYRVFEVEGLAYEYWRTSAALRTIGKGTAVEWNVAAAWFTYSEDEVHPLLFELYDARIGSSRGFQTSLGTWSELGNGNEDGDTFFFATYNPHPETKYIPFSDPITGRDSTLIAALNFRIGSGSLSRFASAHSFMAEAFFAGHSVNLEAVIFCIWAVSSFAVFPQHLYFAKYSNATSASLFNNSVNLLQRGYSITGVSLESLTEEAIGRARAEGYETALNPDEVTAGFRFMLLDNQAQAAIALWSGGKRPVLILQDDRVVVDLAAVIPFLRNLFFRIREKTGAKGPAFEDGVREAIKQVGLSLVHSGELVWGDGRKREVDAAIRLGDRLVLVECFSHERPLDFELSRPGVFEGRQRRLADKTEQARSLYEAILNGPTGRNFDFSWASSVDWRLASPFVEFAWSLEMHQFDEEGVARILQVGELLDYLTEGERPGGELAGLVRRARAASGQPQTTGVSELT
jgi:hypothetical protein